MTEGILTILAGGDVLLNGPFADEMMSCESSCARKLISEIEKADITFVNLETPLGTKGYGVAKPGLLRVPPIIAKDLHQVGIDVVSLANNHMLDYGYETMFETIDTLDKHGIKHAGAGRDIEDAMKEAAIEVKGKKIAFMSFACTLPLEAGAAKERPGIAPIHVKTAYQICYPPEFDGFFAESVLEEPGIQPVVRTFLVDEDVERMKKRITAVKEQSDSIIMGVHWGLPYQEELCEYQTPLAHAMIDAGADIVVGHHPHRIHAVEVYGGKPIFYSVGNLVLFSNLTEVMKKLLRVEALVLKIMLDGEKMRVEPMPIRIDDKGHPYIAEGEDRSNIIGFMQRLSTPLGTIINHDESQVTIWE